jgi:hypothetical protein
VYDDRRGIRARPFTGVRPLQLPDFACRFPDVCCMIMY